MNGRTPGRTNWQTLRFEQEFMQQGIPYSLTQGQRLYHRREVRDILAYLAIAENGDEASLTQIINSPPRGIGPVSVQKIKGLHPHLTWDHLFAVMTRGEEMKLPKKVIEAVSQLYDLLMDLQDKCKQLDPAEFSNYVLEKTGYRAWLTEDVTGEARLAPVRELQREAAEYSTVVDFLAAVQEKINADAQRPDEAGVVLGTIHAVKGLQFDAVFVVGMEEGLLPHVKALEGEADLEGERRLAHVAMTRARDRLYLVGAQRRERGGRPVESRPSRFLADLPPEVVSSPPAVVDRQRRGDEGVP